MSEIVAGLTTLHSEIVNKLLAKYESTDFRSKIVDFPTRIEVRVFLKPVWSFDRGFSRYGAKERPSQKDLDFLSDFQKTLLAMIPSGYKMDTSTYKGVLGTRVFEIFDYRTIHS